MLSPCTDLSAVTINFQSILAKRAHLLCFINEHNPDIIFGTETWLSSTVSSSEISLSGYNIFRKDRKDGYGGVLLALRDNISAKEYPLDSNCKIMACEVFLVTVLALLSAPFMGRLHLMLYIFKICAHSLENLLGIILILLYGYQEICINLPNIDWEHGIMEGNSYPLSLCDLILEFMMNYGFV